MSDSGEHIPPRAIACPVSAGGKDGTWRARKGEREVSGISRLPIPLTFWRGQRESGQLGDTWFMGKGPGEKE